jgi:hypothetical protein
MVFSIGTLDRGESERTAVKSLTLDNAKRVPFSPFVFPIPGNTLYQSYRIFVFILSSVRDGGRAEISYPRTLVTSALLAKSLSTGSPPLLAIIISFNAPPAEKSLYLVVLLKFGYFVH